MSLKFAALGCPTVPSALGTPAGDQALNLGPVGPHELILTSVGRRSSAAEPESRVRMLKLIAMTPFAVLILWSTSVSAWWDGGHMQIAAVAYTKLTPAAKSKVDVLIKLNPDYPSWVACLPADQVDKLAFVRASVWADDIKVPGHGHTSAGDSPTGERAGQNIGYADDLMHKYWHFKDIGFSTDGTAIKLADPVNALTQIKLFKTALPSSSGVSNDVRSYDLVWLLHLVGDAHQPLHATARFSQDLLDGDMGGNKETVKPATGEVLLLHAYWDRMFGGYTTPQGAVLDANSDGAIAHVSVDAALATIDDPEVWFKESFEQAKKFAYAEPVLSGVQPIELTRDYETGARNTALSQAALAAQRLANMLNEAFR
jgi:hypothetical protein